MPIPIRAGDRPTPLPSEVLGSLDGGRGIAAFVLTPADLDRLPILSSYPPEEVVEEPVTAAVVPPDEDRFAEELLVDLRRLGDTYGPLGVAVAAASFTDPQVLVARVTETSPRDLRPEPFEHEGSEPLAEQVGRLADWIMENAPGEPSRSEGAVDTAIRLLSRDTVYREEVEEQTTRAEQEQARRLRAERLLDGQQRATINLRDLLDGERTRAEAAEGERDEARAEVVSLGQQLEACRAQQVRQAATIAARATTSQTGEPLPVPDPLGDRRPRLDRWPDDAVTLTYPELRRLVALHLDRYCDPVSGRAMREGDVPLRLAEVLDR